MNRSYRSVWNAALGACVAVAENVRAPGQGKAAGSRGLISTVIAGAVAVLASTANAATYTAANEVELATAINNANGDADPSSTISLTGTFLVTAALPQITKSLSIESNGFVMSTTTNIPLDVAAGVKVIASGSTTGLARLIKAGSGTLVLTDPGLGSSYSGRIEVAAGDLRVENGRQIIAGSSADGGLDVTGDNTRAVISGAGSTVTTRVSSISHIQSAAGSTLEVLGGGTFAGGSAIMQIGDLAGTAGSITVSGANSTLTAGGTQARGGSSTIRVLDGGQLVSNAAVALGGTTSPSTGTSHVLVDGANSRFTYTGTYYQHRGTLDISGGGVLQGTGNIILSAPASSTFDGLVTGAGSTLAVSGTFVLRGLGGGDAVLTLADGGTLSAGVGSVPVTVAGWTGTATLNIGAAAGSASAAPGIFAAPSIRLFDANATLNFNHNAADYQFAAAIDGPGNVTQTGSGTTTLTGVSTYSGPTTVSAGTLAVNGSITSTVNVLAAGRLKGSGSIGGATVAGTIAPGNSIGTLSIAGNLTQAAGSVYEAEVDPASNASDLIHASGSATLASGSQLKVVRAGAATFGIGNRYTVLSADGGITGTYQLAGDTQSAFVRVVDSYDANNVYLTVEKARTIASAGGTGNETAVGAAIDSMPAGNALSTAVTWLPNDAAARDALNQLSADIHASTRSAMLEDSRFVREAAIDRLRSAACAPGGTTPPQQRAGATCTPEAGTGGTGWAQVFGSWGHIDSDGNASRLDRDIGGFMVGADTAVGAGWRAGGLLGYSRSNADTSARNSDSKTDSYHLAVYGGTQWDATALRLGLGHSWNHVDTERSVAFPGFAGNLTSDYDSGTTQAFAEVGHRIDMGRAALEPFAGLAYVSLGSSSFSEQGGPAALYGQGDSLSTTFSSLGVRASVPVGEQTRLRGMLAWRHVFGDSTPTTTQIFSGSLPFTLSGVPLAENVAALDAGVETQLRPNLTLAASYSGQVGGGLQDHGAKVELNWKF